MMLLALIGAALAASVVTAGAIALFQRAEIARVAESRRVLTHEWSTLARVWEHLDPDSREQLHHRLTGWQRIALSVALVKDARERSL